MHQPVTTEKSSLKLFTKKDILLTSIISFVYLLLSKILIGYKFEQVVLVIIFNALFHLSFTTRKFITGFSIFIIFWIIFDYMKAFPNYLYNKVHIESLYNAEKSIFGIHVKDQIITPNEFWNKHSYASLDVISGIFYLCWVPVPLMFATYLYFTNRRQFMYFSLTFLLVNIIGFIGYYVYPAAPPWYIQKYGFQFQPRTPGNTAGLQRFDDFFHVGIFHALYAKSSNVFGAMPSLHSAYNMIVLYFGIKNRLGLINLLFAIIMAGIWFAAVYSGHHYLLDVLAGMGCATIGIILFEQFLTPNKWFQNTFIENFVKD